MRPTQPSPSGINSHHHLLRENILKRILRDTLEHGREVSQCYPKAFNDRKWFTVCPTVDSREFRHHSSCRAPPRRTKLNDWTSRSTRTPVYRCRTTSTKRGTTPRGRRTKPPGQTGRLLAGARHRRSPAMQPPTSPLQPSSPDRPNRHDRPNRPCQMHRSGGRSGPGTVRTRRRCPVKSGHGGCLPTRVDGGFESVERLEEVCNVVLDGRFRGGPSPMSSCS